MSDQAERTVASYTLVFLVWSVSDEDKKGFYDIYRQIDVKMAKERENKYAMDLSKGCYMYYFRTNNRQYW
jgi:hypothetical protein